MIKFIPQDTSVVFREIPDEISLAINISNCQNNCVGCHSAYLKQNLGEELTETEADSLIEKNKGVTCICFMGEGNDFSALTDIMQYIKSKYGLKIALYSGRNEVNEELYYKILDYLKIGPYIAELGPLDNPKTNQRLYMKVPFSIETDISGKKRKNWMDITGKFWDKQLLNK